MTNTNTEKKTLTERVQEELIKRLTDAEWHKITINMKKSSHDLTISPCAQTTDINKLEDVEYFLVESPELPWLGGNTIEIISEQIANYDKYLAENDDEKKQLRDFYKKHLSGHTEKELRDGNSYFGKIYDIWRQNSKNSDISLDDLIATYDMSTLTENNDTVDYIKTAIGVSTAFSTYSDWYKDVYGRRPRIEGDF